MSETTLSLPGFQQILIGEKPLLPEIQQLSSKIGIYDLTSLKSDTTSSIARLQQILENVALQIGEQPLHQVTEALLSKTGAIEPAIKCLEYELLLELKLTEDMATSERLGGLRTHITI